MKYIRTKDGIFEFAKRFDLEHYKKVGFSDEDIVRKFIRNGNKIANTIEELCDYLTYYNTFGDLILKKLPHNEDEENNDYYFIRNLTFNYFTNEYDKRMRLAILTDKGLIYVAKMNDKGELELL